jgi:hypothetical protein
MESLTMTEEEKLEFHNNACKMWAKCISNWDKYKKQYISIYGKDAYNHFYTMKPILFPEDECEDLDLN